MDQNISPIPMSVPKKNTLYQDQSYAQERLQKPRYVDILNDTTTDVVFGDTSTDDTNLMEMVSAKQYKILKNK